MSRELARVTSCVPDLVQSLIVPPSNEPVLRCPVLDVQYSSKQGIHHFFFSSRYTTPAQCWAQNLAWSLNSSKSSWVQGCGRMGQTSKRFIVCPSPHSHVVCPSSLNPHLCLMDLHRPVPVQRRFRLHKVGHASLEPGGSDSLGLNKSLCGVVWTWLTRGSVCECGRCRQGLQQSGGSCVLILVSFWLDIAVREYAEGRFLVCVSQAGMRLPV